MGVNARKKLISKQSSRVWRGKAANFVADGGPNSGEQKSLNVFLMRSSTVISQVKIPRNMLAWQKRRYDQTGGYAFCNAGLCVRTSGTRTGNVKR